MCSVRCKKYRPRNVIIIIIIILIIIIIITVCKLLLIAIIIAITKQPLYLSKFPIRLIKASKYEPAERG